MRILQAVSGTEAECPLGIYNSAYFGKYSAVRWMAVFTISSTVT